jgi:predicted RNase H-like HicB family nuclease
MNIPVSERFTLPIGEKFTIYVDEEGDYIIQSKREPGLQAHGSTPDEAVYAMREILDMAASLEEKESQV